MSFKTKAGYSLIEIMLGLVIAAGIIVGILQLAQTINNRMKVEKTKSILRVTKSGIDQFQIDIGRFPTKLDELITPPANSDEKRRWQGPYVPEKFAEGSIITDPYGNEIVYNVDQQKKTFEVFSWGKVAGSDVGNIFVD